MQVFSKTVPEEQSVKPNMDSYHGKGKRVGERVRGPSEIIRDILQYIGSKPAGTVRQNQIMQGCGLGSMQFQRYKSIMINRHLMTWNIVDRSFLVTQEGFAFVQTVNKLEELLDGLNVSVEESTTRGVDEKE